MKEWLVKWTEREWVALILVGLMIYKLAMAGMLTPEVVAVIIPVTGFIWKRTESKD